MLQESGCRSDHHLRLPPLWPGFDPRLVRGLWLVDLKLTPRVFLPILRFFSLRKNQLSRQNISRRAYYSRASVSGGWVTTPNVTTLLYKTSCVKINKIVTKLLASTGHVFVCKTRNNPFSLTPNSSASTRGLYAKLVVASTWTSLATTEVVYP